MSYENAPATKLLATHCAVCGRPLLDSDSVEIGIGPICRGRYLAELDSAPDWTAVTDHLMMFASLDESSVERVVMAETAMNAIADATAGDDHTMANTIVHYIAATQKSHVTGLGNLILAIRAMGRARLAGILAERIYAVRVLAREGLLLVRAPYSDSFRASARRMQGRWDVQGKYWSFVEDGVFGARERLVAALSLAYSGQRALGPAGDLAL